MKRVNAKIAGIGYDDFVTFEVWHRKPQIGRLGEWGGILDIPSGVSPGALMLKGNLIIETEKGERGEIVVTSISGNSPGAEFTGSGQPPQSFIE